MAGQREDLNAVFRDVETQFESTNLGSSRWYIVVLACLVAGPDPEAAAALYQFLCEQRNYSTPASRKALVCRLREVLIKSVSLVGVCKPIEAVLAISKVERDEDRDFSATREGWQCDDANLERGRAWFSKLYAGNSNATLQLFDAHRDFAWLSERITYGLYLSDRQVLDDVDTEMVVLSAIAAQNLPTESWWHIRGTRRIGVSQADIETVLAAVKAVCGHFGTTLDRLPSVAAVESDV